MEQPSPFKLFLMKIWPTIYSAINAIAYFLLHFTVNGIKKMIQQVKGQ